MADALFGGALLGNVCVIISTSLILITYYYLRTDIWVEYDYTDPEDIQEEAQPMTGFLDLPRELRDMIISMIPVPSGIALKTTCRQLYHSGPPLPVLYYQARKCPRMRHELLLFRENDGLTSGQISCSACQQLHTPKYFASEQLGKDGATRVCKGGQGRIWMSRGRSISFRDFDHLLGLLYRSGIDIRSKGPTRANKSLRFFGLMHRNFPWSSHQQGAHPLCICFFLEHSHKKDYLLSTIWHLDLDALARYEPKLSPAPEAVLKILKDCSHRVCPHHTFDSLQENTRFTDHVTSKRQVLTTKCSRGCKISILCHSPKLSIRTIRNLGKGISAADPQWLNQVDTGDVENAHHLINYPTPQEIAMPPSRPWRVVIPPEKAPISKATIHSYVRLGLLFICVLACLILLWDISSHPREYRTYANRQLATLRLQ